LQLLCDSKADNFVIRHASQDFLDLYGYSAAECWGQDCGALVLAGGEEEGAESSVADMAANAGLAPEVVSGCLATLASEFQAAVERALKGGGLGAGDRSELALALGRKKNGAVFVCEVAVRDMRHPKTGWSYGASEHVDVTSEVPVAELLGATARGAYAQLLKGRETVRGERRASKLDGYAPDSQVLDDAAGGMWQALMKDKMKNGPEKKTRQGTPSLASESTAAGSRVSVSTAASAKSRGSSDALPQRQLSTHTHSEVSKRDCNLHLVLDRFDSYQLQERFLDLLSSDSDAEQPRSAEQAPCAAMPLQPVALDSGLQACLNQLGSCNELYDLGFALAVIDPSPAGGFVACSAGFSELTGYPAQQVLGNGSELLLHGVPSSIIFEEALAECRKQRAVASRGKYYPEEQGHGVIKLGGADAVLWPVLPHGELVCMQTLARRSGEIYRCMLHLKQVELEDHMFLLELQAPLHAPIANGTTSRDEEREAFQQLCRNMDILVTILAAQFWYAAPLRRQVATSQADEDN